MKHVKTISASPAAAVYVRQGLVLSILEFLLLTLLDVAQRIVKEQEG